MEKVYDFIEGEILAFDKPLTWTSFNLVKAVRNNLSRRLGIKRLRVGHAGTLDPLASGVLLLCTGKCTKQIDQLQAGTKEYIATIRLGYTTLSFDAEHPINGTYPTDHITVASVHEALSRFKGSIWQVPPMLSAVKVEGRRAYDFIRQGEEVELKAKELVIDELELLDLHLPAQGVVSPNAEEVSRIARAGINIKEYGRDKDQYEIAEAENIDPQHLAYLQIRVVCSKGTYIRALARDIGEALGSGAYLISLRRTRIGDYRVEDCMPVDQIEEWCKTVPLTLEHVIARDDRKPQP